MEITSTDVASLGLCPSCADSLKAMLVGIEAAWRRKLDRQEAQRLQGICETFDERVSYDMNNHVGPLFKAVVPKQDWRETRERLALDSKRRRCTSKTLLVEVNECMHVVTSLPVFEGQGRVSVVEAIWFLQDAIDEAAAGGHVSIRGTGGWGGKRRDRQPQQLSRSPTR